MKVRLIKISTLLVLCLFSGFGIASASDKPEPDPDPEPWPTETPSTYYVERRGPGASDSNPGTSIQPWLTIQHAADIAKPGDTIIVVGDTYPERVQINRSGTISSPITYRTEGHVITRGFTIEADFNHIIGFEIADTEAMHGEALEDLDGNTLQRDCAGVFIQGKGNQIIGNYIHDTTCMGVHVFANPMDSAGTSLNVIRNNTIHRAGHGGIWVYGVNNLIEDNEISHSLQFPAKWTDPPSRLDADGIRFVGRDHTIRGNYIHDITFADSENIDPHIDCFQTWTTAIDIVVEGNVCDIPKPPDWTSFQIFMVSSATGEVRGLTIRNNIFRTDSTGYAPITLRGMIDYHGSYDPSGTYIKDVTIVHNTFVRTNGLGIYGVRMQYVENAVVMNNIFYDYSKTGYVNCEGACTEPKVRNLQLGHNLIYESATTPSGPWDPDDLWQQDPRFMDFSAGDYRLRPDSPAINAGIDLRTILLWSDPRTGRAEWVDQVTSDFDGNTRPLLGGFDIGAYESEAMTTPTPTFTSTATPTLVTITPSVTSSPTFTSTAAPTLVTITPSVTPSPTFTSTPTPTLVTITPSVSPSPTFTATATPTFATVTPTPTPTFGTPASFFVDVPEDFWAYPYIKTLYEDGFVSGVSSDPPRFGTGQGLTRAEAAVFVVRGVEGAEFHPLLPVEPPFADTPLSHWAVEWVYWLKQLGFTEGCGTNPAGEVIFCVDFPLTRAEATVFFVRMLEGVEFTPPEPDPNRGFMYGDVDTDNSDWANKWIYWAWDKGIVGSCEDPVNLQDNLFRPYDTVLREEAACMMYNALYTAVPGTPTSTPTPIATALPPVTGSPGD